MPIVAEPRLDDVGEHAVEKQTDMAAVTLVAPDGTRALPVFSSMAAITAWDPQARPVPVTAARAAQAAVSERCDVMVVDVAGPRDASRCVRAWSGRWPSSASGCRPTRTTTVRRAVAAAVREQEAVRRHELGAGAPGEGVLRVPCTWLPGLDGTRCRRWPPRSGERLATDGEIRARIDGLAFSIC